jgi:hypothetical protein
MNYIEALKIIKEMNLAGTVLGYGDNTIGQHGGSVGNDPNAWVNDYINTPIDYLHGTGEGKGKKTNKKKRNAGKKPNRIHVYKRNFVESLMENESEYMDGVYLTCTVFTENINYKQIICDIIKKNNIHYEISEKCVLFGNTDKNIQCVLETMQTILTEEPFICGEIIALIGELDIE